MAVAVAVAVGFEGLAETLGGAAIILVIKDLGSRNDISIATCQSQRNYVCSAGRPIDRQRRKALWDIFKLNLVV